MDRYFLSAGLLLLAQAAGAQSVNVIMERPGANACVAPGGLPASNARASWTRWPSSNTASFRSLKGN